MDVFRVVLQSYCSHEFDRSCSASPNWLGQIKEIHQQKNTKRQPFCGKAEVSNAECTTDACFAILPLRNVARPAAGQTGSSYPHVETARALASQHAWFNHRNN